MATALTSGGSSGAKKPKKTTMKDDEEEIEDLEELIDDKRKQKRATQSMYSRMKEGKFITKGTDRKARLDKRTKWIEEAQKTDDDDDDDDNEEVTEIERIEHETRELESQLKKAEWRQQRDKEEGKKLPSTASTCMKGST